VSWKDLVCLIIALVGVALFLYGSNVYDAMFGWSGLSLIAVGLIAELFLGAYEALRKRGS
jgi:uncharacterized membrane protein